MNSYQLRDGFLRVLRTSSNQVVVIRAEASANRCGPYKSVVGKGSSPDDSVFFFDEDAIVSTGNCLQVVGSAVLWEVISVIDQVVDDQFIQRIVQTRTCTEISQSNKPALDAKNKDCTAINWHPKVYQIAQAYLEKGMDRSAITDTFIALDNYVQERSGLLQNGTSLMQTVFSAKNPILRLSNQEEEQAGYMMLFAGAIKAVRNQYTHKLAQPQDTAETVDWLSFASALFRLVDMSVKENPSNPKS